MRRRLWRSRLSPPPRPDVPLTSGRRAGRIHHAAPNKWPGVNTSWRPSIKTRLGRANSARWIDSFFFFFCGRTRLSKRTFGRRSSYRAEDSQGPRLEHNSDQCPASRNYCLLWLIIPPSFDRVMVPNGSGEGEGEGGESGVLNLERGAGGRVARLRFMSLGRDEVLFSW